MKKTTLLMIMSIVMALTLSLGSTLAYLTSEDSDVNIMTMGNIRIEQHEYEREFKDGEYVTDTDTTDDDEYKLQDYTQNKPMLPAVYPDNLGDPSNDVDFSEKEVETTKKLYDNDEVRNIQDKIVVVENTGLNDAWVRTVVAYEYPATLPVDENSGEPTLLHIVKNTTEYTEEDGFFTVIDGIRYWVETYVYNNKLVKGATTEPSLMQVYLDKKVNSQQAALFGDQMQILVVSQAVQADGFDNAKDALDEAFYVIGDSTVTANASHPWVSGSGVSIVADTNWYKANPDATEFEIRTAAELAGLAKLVNDGNSFAGKTINLMNDIDLKNSTWTPIGFYNSGSHGSATATFNGNFNGNNHTIKNLLVNNEDYSGLFGAVNNGGVVQNLTIEGFNIRSTHWAGAVAGWVQNATITGCIVKTGFVSCQDTTVTTGEGDHGHIANGDKAGAVVGYIQAAGAAASINNVAAYDVTVTANRDAGQLVGCMYHKTNWVNNDLDSCTVSNVNVAWNGYGAQENIKNEPVGRIEDDIH